MHCGCIVVMFKHRFFFKTNPTFQKLLPKAFAKIKKKTSKR